MSNSALRREMSVRTIARFRRWRGDAIVGVVAALMLLLVIVFPLLEVLRIGLRSKTLVETVTNARLQRIAWFTFWQAAVSTGLVLGAAVVLSGLIARQNVVGRRFALAFLAAPFTMPTVVVATAMLQLLPDARREGVLAILAAHVFFNLGIATIACTAALESIDTSQLEAAATLGANRRARWWTIEWPLLRPTLASIGGVVFVLCFTSFGVVLLLGGPRRSTIEVEIARQALQLGRVDRAAALGIVQLVVLTVGLVLTSRHSAVARRDLRARATLTDRTTDARTSPIMGTFALAIAVVSVAAPLVALLARSLRTPGGGMDIANYRALTRVSTGSGLLDAPIQSVLFSIRTAAFAVVLTMAVGSVLVLVRIDGATQKPNRARRVRPVGWRQSVWALGSLPLVTSAVLLGLGALVAFDSAPVNWRTNPWLLVALQSAVALPFVIRSLAPSADALDRRVIEVATTLGASPLRAWASVHLPLLRAPFIRAAGIAAAVSIGEFGATSFLARPQTPTMPVAIARLASRPGDVVQGQAAALAVLLCALTIVFQWVPELLSRRSRVPA